jgi:hypothetical protein
MKKLISLLLVLLVISSLSACTSSPAEEPVVDEGSQVECSDGSTLTLEQINEFLNTSADMGEGTIANKIAVVPIDHIDGPRNESKFYAFVNYKYKARDYIKYQITYLSCTCRAASVNYWQTAYVELTLPESLNADDVSVRYLSFDKDPNGEYNGGFWGDSNPTPAGITYNVFKTEFVSYFEDKTFGYIKTLSVMEDIALEDYQADGREAFKIDTFTGSSVSTNNIIRMLHAIVKYHLEDEYFK